MNNKRLSIGDMMQQGRGLWESGSKLKLPELCGDFMIRINHKGQWFYQGSPIGRVQLCQLFAVCLLKEGDDYFLATPGEKGKIMVDDLPFYGILADIKPDQIAIKSSLDFWVVLDKDHPLKVSHSKDGKDQKPRPIVKVRDNLDMLLSPSVFYDLANHALNEREMRGEDETTPLYITSQGEKFFLS